MRLFREAERLAPDKVGVQIGIARAALALGRAEEGIKALDRAAELNPAVREDAEWKDLRQRLSQTAATPADGSPVQAALAELDRQIAAIPTEKASDAEALRSIRDRLAKEAKTGPALSAVDRRQIEQLAEVAGKADPCGAEFASSVQSFLSASEPVMFRHPDQLRLLALRVRVALHGYCFDEAWTTGRVLIAMGADRAEADTAVLDALVALRQAGCDNWRRTEAEIDSSRSLARTLVREARTAVDAMGDSTWKQSHLYRTAALQAESGDIVEALQTATLIVDSRRRADVLRSIADAQADSGDFEAALSTLSRISDGRDESVLAQPSVLRVLVRAGRVDRAREIATNSAIGNERDWALRVIAEQQAEGGDAAGAMQTLSLISDGSKRALALASIVGDRARSGDVDGAMITAREIVDPMAKDSAFGSIANALVVRGDCDGAIDAVAMIAETDTRVLVLLDALELCVRRGDRLNAERFADASARAISGIIDPDVKVWRLSRLADGQSAINHREAALSTLQQASEEASRISDEGRRDMALSRVAASQADSGDFNAAVRTAARVGEQGLGFADPLVGIAIRCERAGDRATAMKIMYEYCMPAEAEPMSRRASTIATLAKDVMNHSVDSDALLVSKRELAQALLSDAERALQHISDHLDKFDGLCDIAEANIEVGELDDAIRHLRVASQTAMTEDETGVYQLQRVGTLLARSGDAAGAEQAFEHARRLAAATPRPERRAKQLASITEDELEAVDAVRSARATACVGLVNAHLQAKNLIAAVIQARCAATPEPRSAGLLTVAQWLMEVEPPSRVWPER